MKRRPRIKLWLHVLILVMLAISTSFAMWFIFTSSRTGPLDSKPSDVMTLEIIRLIFYAIAGIGGIVALTVAYRRQGDNEAAELREQSKHFNERFAAAADQLSAEKTVSRLAGIYAFSNLADDWDAGRQMCINVLCGYLRMYYESPHATTHDHRHRDDRVDEDGWSNHQQRHEEQQLRELIIDVIGEKLRTEPIEGKTWHWCRFNFNSVVFDGGNLTGAKFLNEKTSFEYAHFPCGIMEFIGAEFHGDVSFIGSDFEGGIADFRYAKFLGQVTDFTSASIRFDSSLYFVETQFGSTSTSFEEIACEGGRLYFHNTKFGGVEDRVGILSFSEAQFVGTDIQFVSPELDNCEIDLLGVQDWALPPGFGPPGMKLPEQVLIPSDITFSNLYLSTSNGQHMLDEAERAPVPSTPETA